MSTPEETKLTSQKLLTHATALENLNSVAYRRKIHIPRYYFHFLSSAKHTFAVEDIMKLVLPISLIYHNQIPTQFPYDITINIQTRNIQFS